jgi:hypothetical protein
MRLSLRRNLLVVLDHVANFNCIASFVPNASQSLSRMNRTLFSRRCFMELSSGQRITLQIIHPFWLKIDKVKLIEWWHYIQGI